ncbi:hypothetical protein [Priestia endophytica]|uniref:hypothetical protein n=1 Tax=Priestia endophytica TaxID=135735 RepID=UPI0018CF4338|nr:hypothetical protein [Priestia endophytica]
MRKWIISAVLYLFVVIAVYSFWESFNEEPKDEHQDHQSTSYQLSADQNANVRM